MAKKTDANAETRTPLTRERVLRAAIGLADEVGIDAFSMRRLGQELGVEAMSLYNHVANKDDILDAIVDMVVGEIGLPAEGEDWKAAMRRRAVSARKVLLRHPWAASLIESRTNVGPARLRYYDTVIGSLRKAGFTIKLAQRAFLALDSHIYGFVIQELSWPMEAPGDLAAVTTEILQRLPTDEYPHFTELALDRIQHHSPADDSDFEFGLDLILDGLERARDATDPT